MADHVKDQVRAYFAELASRAQPVGPTGSSEDRGTERARARHRAPLLVGAAVFVVLVSVIGVLIVSRSTREPTGTLLDGADAKPCSSIVVEVQPVAGVDPVPLTQDDVLYFQRTTDEMSGWNEPMVVVGASGQVIAQSEDATAWKSTDLHVGYEMAMLTSASVESLRACLVSDAFRALELEYLEQQGESEDGQTFCSLSDASVDILSAGPAADAVKSVSVYGMLQTASSEPATGGCDLDRPPALRELWSAAEEIRQAVEAVGDPTTPPSDDLDPTT